MIVIETQFVNRHNRGAVLSFVVFLTVVLSLLGVAILRLGMNARIQAVYATTEMSARTAADAGMTQAMGLLNKKITNELVWDETDIPSAENVLLPNCSANYSFIIEGDPSSGYNITSVGESRSKQKIINASLRLRGLYEYAIFADSEIELKMGTTIDDLNSGADDLPLQIGTNSIDAEAIGLKSDITIDGNVVVGPGGDPDVVIEEKLNADIEGYTYPLTQTWDLPTITVPATLASAPSQGQITGGEVITASGKYDSININGTNQVVTIDGDVTLYITGDTMIGNTCTIEIVKLVTNPNASLTLYLGGNYLQKADAEILNLTKDPKRLTIYGLETCESIMFLSESTFYGTIYAPYAELELFNRVDIYGSIIVDTFLQRVTADFHYDESLREVDIDDIGVTFAVSRWYEE